jgi:vacuolar protein sorting-associated protein IST1
VQLKLAISRLRMVQQKDTALAKQQRRSMAQLLEQGKDESAKIRVENIIRSDIDTELLEILELYCELLLARTGLMEAKDCDAGLEEAVKSIIYAAPRTEIKELHQVRALLVEKYGKEFALDAMENKDDRVAERVLKKLRIEPPPPELVTLYLQEIARTYGVAWPRQEHAADAGDNEDDDEPGDGEKEKNLEEPLTTDELTRATPPRDVGGPKSPVHVAPPSPSTENASPRVKLPGPPELKPSAKMTGAAKKPTEKEAKNPVPSSDSKTNKSPVGGKIPDVDDLAKRFAALKK